MNKPIIEAACLVEGVEYHALSTSAVNCDGCGFREAAQGCLQAGPCVAATRSDRTDVIWVRA